MPSQLHEVFIELFRGAPSLSAELLRRVFGVELPAYDQARPSSENFTQLDPQEFRADAAIAFSQNGVPRLGVVVEAQLGDDDDKSYAWPVYVTAFRARIRAPVYLLVVTNNKARARRLSRKIVIGHPGFALEPLVLGPEQVPRIDTIAEAQKYPELGLLSALAHGNEPDGLAIVIAASAGLLGLDEDHARLYHDLLMNSLNQAVKKELEAMVLSGKYEYQSDFAKKHFSEGQQAGRQEGQQAGLQQGRQEGRQEGLRGALLTVVRTRWGADAAQQAEVRLTDAAAADLERWLAVAITASTIDAVFADQ